jgi:hypothetical protein
MTAFDTTIYFKNADGEVSPVRLPATDAALACAHHPHEWARTVDGFAPPRVKVDPEPEGEAASAPWQVAD